LPKKPPTFIEYEGSLLCSQDPATGPNNGSDEYSPHPTLL
jgi:hypothetical protein